MYLKRPDPFTTKKICIIALTRIFTLTQQFPTLLREIATPLFPGFVGACLNVISPKQSSGQRSLKQTNPLLEVVLASFKELLPRFPTTFRPFAPQVHPLLLTILSGGSESAILTAEDTKPIPHPITEAVRTLARDLLIALHFCAPKNTSGGEWLNVLGAIMSAIKQSADQIFRAVIEDWEPSDPAQRHSSSTRVFSEPPCQDGPDAMGLSPWAGLRLGARRLAMLLDLLATSVSAPTSASVALPLGSLLDTTARLCSVTAPSMKKGQYMGVRLHVEVSRDEREELWVELPSIHMATLQVLSAVVNTLQDGVLSAIQPILDQLLWVFQAEHSSVGIRIRSYLLVERVLSLAGFSMSSHNIKALGPIISVCCSDLLLIQENGVLSSTKSNDTGSNAKMKSSSSINADSFLAQPVPLGSVIFEKAPEVRAAATTLLPSLLTHVPSELMPRPLRTQIDRTAILINHREALVSSVLNPPPETKARNTASSVMPFLARAYGDDINIEGILRPRLPVLGTISTSPSLDILADEMTKDDDIGSEEDGGSLNGKWGSSVDILNELENSLDSIPPDNAKQRKPVVAPTPAEATQVRLTIEESNNVSAKRDRTTHGPDDEIDTTAIGSSRKKARLSSFQEHSPVITSTVATERSSVVKPTAQKPKPAVKEHPEAAPDTKSDSIPARIDDPVPKKDSDSDDSEGIPTLNIEPDTDEEEEDEE